MYLYALQRTRSACLRGSEGRSASYSGPFRIRSVANKLTAKKSPRGGAMVRQTDSELTISCLQCEWSVEAANTSVQASTAFLEAAYAHVDAHEQHALEIVQRLRVYSVNYVEPAPPCPRCAGCHCQTGYGYAGRSAGQGKREH